MRGPIPGHFATVDADVPRGHERPLSPVGARKPELECDCAGGKAAGERECTIGFRQLVRHRVAAAGAVDQITMDADAGFDFEDEAGIDGTGDGQITFPMMLAVELGTVFKESRESGRSICGRCVMSMATV